ncbi:ATP-binding cassette domain-containing protein [Natronococcus sp. A-GB1]|uniref:ATP-binding cassette domain-containing protein n=1 Tax=Natronococcus sp. A-GB1 TaxID=3037648 RepID=UPI00241E05AB|nr:ATP-binding cassette domain-containing protein [Natronococcus sp. A-GB1]MDG5759145.1 ATP-binding cassette domain-containing protein [Natronococcus sp. A-GB1]
MSALETNELTKRYGGRPVVDALDLAVERGEVFGLVGPTGAGKSTLLDLLAGSVRPSRGSATVLGLSHWHDRDRLHERVGYLRETVDLDGTRSGWEHLRTATGRTIDDEAIPGVESMIEQSGQLVACVSDADAKATVVLEVAHAGAAIHDLAVAAPDDSNRQRSTDSRTTDGER